jgi:zinc protease
MDLAINAGGSLDTAEKAGVASLTASMLGQGTNKRSALEISNGLQSIGAQVGSAATWDSSGVSMQTLTKNLDQALDFYADEVTNPAFPNELKQLRDVQWVVSANQGKRNAVAGWFMTRCLRRSGVGRQLSGDERRCRPSNAMISSPFTLVLSSNNSR